MSMTFLRKAGRQSFEFCESDLEWVSHLPGLRRTLPEEDGRRADAAKPHVRFDEGAQETCDTATRLCLLYRQPLPDI